MNGLNDASIEKVCRALDFFLMGLYTIGFICNTICAAMILLIFHYHGNFLMFFIYIGNFFLQYTISMSKISYISSEEALVRQYPVLFKKILTVGTFFGFFFLALKTYVLFHCFDLHIHGLPVHPQCAGRIEDDPIYPTGYFTLAFASMILCTVISFLFIFSINTEEKPVKSQPEKSSQEVHTKQE